MPVLPPAVRFRRHVRTDPSGCLIWTGRRAGKPPHQYGYFNPTTSAKGRRLPAHRWAYEQEVGKIPDGLELDHRCHVKLCVNTAHLEPVTHTENRRRGRLTVCRAGLHDLTRDENVRWDSAGNRRGCKLCYQQRARERGTR